MSCGFQADRFLGIIKINLVYLQEDALVMLYKSLVRSHLEYANSVWNPYRHGLIKDLEKVQIRATKLVRSIKHLKYNEHCLFFPTHLSSVVGLLSHTALKVSM